MSLLGRLEDLSLADIVQIVYLSRRTGILEIVDDEGRYTVVFRQGLIVNASAPDHSDLVGYLQMRGLVPPDAVRTIRQMEDQGVPCGTAVLELNLINSADLATAIRERILSVVSPLLQSRAGEFNFLLADAMKPVDIEYEPETLFKEGGFPPQKILGAPEGEKLKPLRGLEDSLKAGKALLRSRDAVGAPVPSAADSGPPKESPAPKSPPPSTGQFKVAGGLFEVESPEAAFKNVLVFERNPLIRVAAKRAFSKSGVKIQQFGSLDEMRSAIVELFRSNSFFVTFLELAEGDASLRLLQQIKRRNPGLPVVAVDQRNDIRRRHEILRAGADLYLTKPAAEALEPGSAEEELGLFAEELVMFAERAFTQWEHATGGGPEAGRRFYEQADKDNLDRSFTLLKQLINEVSDPNDIGQVSAMILRLAAEYLDRGALFVSADGELRGVGGFGITNGGESMEARVKRLRFRSGDRSILAEVAAAGEAHRGKMRRTPANVALVDGLGGLLPTEVVALPIQHGGRTIGILYGDNAEHRAPIDILTGLEIFLSQAGYAFGNAAAAVGSGGREAS